MTFFSRSQCPVLVIEQSRNRRVAPATTPTYAARNLWALPLPHACSTA